MTIKRMTNKLLSLFMITNLSRSYQKRLALLKINAAKTYVVGVKKIRFLAIAVLLVLIALAVFICGLLLIHTALFTISPLSVHTKWIAAFTLGVIEIAAAATLMILLFKESTWIRFMDIEQVVRSVTHYNSDHRGGSNETKTNSKKHA